ncbi:maleylpyruvate isomerase family mycothiol-dependent enzyme [Spongiactinospora sp. 9N601]|uniref:maleylpyruvate isomerase family mycothiol-dependent enzyme n=1 Tax=Spongiactinospora sp. 9N601 TaxID=3375149 RepID=UPI00378F598B
MVETGQALRWVEEGQRLFEEQVATADLTEPSLLPGWTRAHVAGHVAGSADALGRLLTGARTGVEAPMYTSDESRAADIERRAATQTPKELYDETVASGRRFAEEFAALPESAWSTQIRHRTGIVFAASDIPWLRAREVWIHSVDLDTGIGFDAFPAGFVDALLDDVSRDLARHDGCPAVTLAPDDRPRTWQIAGTGPAHTATGPAADLLAWTLGRRPAPADLPTLPAWL